MVAYLHLILGVLMDLLGIIGLPEAIQAWHIILEVVSPHLEKTTSKSFLVLGGSALLFRAGQLFPIKKGKFKPKRTCIHKPIIATELATGDKDGNIIVTAVPKL